MKIEKNIMATLESEMDKSSMYHAGLSAEIGIPRMAPQGYLNGASYLSSGSMENLVNQLGDPATELVAAEGHSVSVRNPDLDQLLSNIPALHPEALPIAQQTASLSKIPFKISEELYSPEDPDVDAPRQNFGYLYCLHEMWDPFRRSLSYGIFVKECIHGSWSTVAMVAPFSGDRTAALGLIDLCTRSQLAPEHLLDVVQDFLTQQALAT